VGFSKSKRNLVLSSISLELLRIKT